MIMFNKGSSFCVLLLLLPLGTFQLTLSETFLPHYVDPGVDPGVYRLLKKAKAEIGTQVAVIGADVSGIHVAMNLELGGMKDWHVFQARELVDAPIRKTLPVIELRWMIPGLKVLTGIRSMTRVKSMMCGTTRSTTTWVRSFTRTARLSRNLTFHGIRLNRHVLGFKIMVTD
jgi:hypothetical protein